MANQHYLILRQYPKASGGTFGRYTLQHDDTSTASTKVGGKLKLRSNPFTLRHCVQESFVYDPRFEFAGAATDAGGNPMYNINDAVFASLTNKALARFTGKVRKHNASLGVTLGSIGQSRDMIVDRTQKIASIFEKVEHIHDYDRKVHPEKLARKRRKALKDRAGDFLEWEFGWMPLVSDIQAALGTLGRAFPDRWISASSETAHRFGWRNVGSAYAYNTAANDVGTLRCTIGASVSISNPNTFLLNRLGLLNLPGVAWDLIPWSFVVNMFTNMGQMVNSMTDFAGVNIANASTTKTALITREDHRWAGSDPGQFKTQGYSHSRIFEVQKNRTVGGIPTPSFELKLPELNLELALIAISLTLQKMKKINDLMSNHGLNFTFPSKG